MATEKESSCQNCCANDPNFAIICSFFDRFSASCGIIQPTFLELQEMIESSQDVPSELIDLHVKLLRKIRKSVTTEKWERALIKFCHSYYCSEEGWELERCGYKKCKVSVRLRILKTLLDAQFDLNVKFKTDINKLTAEELRTEPLGRDKVGQSYWCQFDSAANIRVYKEDQDEETWKLVAKDRDGLVDLITQLSSGEELLGLELINEDSNSQEVEKPIIDTGQVEVSTSEDNTADNISSVDMKIENNLKQEDSCTSISSLQNGLCGEDSAETKVLDSNKSLPPVEQNSDTKQLSALPKNNNQLSSNEASCADSKPKEAQNFHSINKDEGSDSVAEINSSQQNVPCSSNNSQDPKSSPSDKNESLENDLIISNSSSCEIQKEPKLVSTNISDTPASCPATEVNKIDVAAEIKQRSLIKSTSTIPFKGKIGKSLDQIFSRKLEQSGISSVADNDKSDTKLSSNSTTDKLDSKPQHFPSNDDESCSQTSILTNDKDDSSFNEEYFKRKPEEAEEHPSKKKRQDLEDEVGEEIEEPVMIIKGLGSGKDCDTGNPGREKEETVTTEDMNNDPPSNSDVKSSKCNQTTSECQSLFLQNCNEISTETVEDDEINSSVNDNKSKIKDLVENECETGQLEIKKQSVSNLEKENLVIYEKETKPENPENLNTKEISVDENVLSVSIINSEQNVETPNCLTVDNKHEKSIEEQLSDITGECFSPKDQEDTIQKMDKCELKCSFTNKDTEKGVRRKSLDTTDAFDNDAIPPEAKKTKVVKDCIDIFGFTNENSYDTSDENNKQLSEENTKTLNTSVENAIELIRNENILTSLSVQNIVEDKSHLKVDIVKPNEAIKFEDTRNSKTYSVDESAIEENEACTLDNNEGCEAQRNDLKVKDSLNVQSKTISQDVLKESSKTVVENSDNEVLPAALDNSVNEGKDEILDGSKMPIPIESSESKVKKSVVADSDKTVSRSKKRRIGVKTKNRRRKVEKIVKLPNLKMNSQSDVKCDENDLKESTNDVSENTEIEELNDIPVKTTVTEKKAEKSTITNKENVNKKKPTSPRKCFKARRKVFTPKSRKKTKKVNSTNYEKNESEGTVVEKRVLKTGKVSSEVKSEKSEQTNEKTKNETEQTHKKAKEPPKCESKPMPIANRKRRGSRRNTGTEKDSEDDNPAQKEGNELEEEEVGGKRRKVKGKRSPNKHLRKSVEEKHNSKSSSEEEAHPDTNDEKDSKKSPPGSAKAKPLPVKCTKKSGAQTKRNLMSPSKGKKEENEVCQVSDEPAKMEIKRKKMKSQGRNSRAYLGIDLNIDINETARSVRQSSRLAQIKIKEQADHKHGDENRDNSEKSGKRAKKKKEENEDNQKGTPRRKKRVKKIISEDDIREEEQPLAEKKRRRRKKKKNPVKAFNERDPWKSSSGSSSEVEEEEEDHFDEIVEEEEELNLTLKSDHEFSPESDLEGDGEVKPIRHARTAQKVTEPSPKGDESKDVDDFACEKCGKRDHPEWILLCDTCDHGWHASCLRPSLMLVPEGDWHCPPCQHTVLLKRLQEILKEFDRDTKRRENEELRRKRLAYVGISLDNVLPSNSHQTRDKKSGSESYESSESASESESEYSDEPVYQLRQRRQGTTSYRFNEFDDLINSAIQDEVEGKHAVRGIACESKNENVVKVSEGTKSSEAVTTATIFEAKVEGDDKTAPPIVDDQSKAVEKTKKKEKNESGDDTSDEDEDNENDDEEEEEFPHVVPKGNNTLTRPGKKKHRKLNSLDDPSDDDDGSDEDFKGSSSEEEEDDEEEEDSDDTDSGRRGRSKRGHLGPVRRSSRTRRARFDKEFINDDSEESDAPRRKKTKKLWSETDSDSDDSTWGRRKKKKSNGSSGRRKFQRNKKFRIEDELSETETSKVPKKKRQRKVKYGGLDDLAVEELPARRTRGKKINYQEVIGSESDEEIQKPKNFRRAITAVEEEYVADKEEKEESGTASDDEEYVEEDEEEKSEEEIKNKIEQKPKSVTSLVKPLPPKLLNKEKVDANRKARPAKAMIAPPPERLISEDEQYKAIVSKVSTLGHSPPAINNSKISNDKCELSLVKTVNMNEQSNSSSEGKDFVDSSHHLTPIKIQNSSFDSKLLKRSPPIKIRSGVPVNACGRRSPVLTSPTKELSFFPIKSSNSDVVHSPPEKLQFPLQMERTLVTIKSGSQQFTTARKSINPPIPVIKTEHVVNDEELDELDDEDLMDDIEEEEEEDEDDSDDDILEEGEIPKKVAKRMARIEERMQRQEERRLAKQVKDLKPVQSGAVSIHPVSPGSAQPPGNTVQNIEQKPTPTTQPTQPLLRVVSPLKLMANPPGPLQSSFMHSGINPRMPMSSPPPARIPMQIRPPQPGNLMPVMNMDDPAKRRGRGRGKKQLAQEKNGQEIIGGSSVIRGMLQQPQTYPPTHYSQQYAPHPRIPFNPQRMPRPPFHPGHHPLDPSPSGGGTINIKQEPGGLPPTNPVHIPNKPPPTAAAPYHAPPPSHRYDSGISRQQNYPQGNPPPKQQYGSYPPPPAPNANYHYGNYPPPMVPREEPQVYPVQQSYNEQYADQQTAPAAPTSGKGFAEEDSGEFGGLVSYFSSQREDDIDT